METTSSGVQPTHTSNSVYNPTFLQETYRTLFGWLEPDFAIQVRASLIEDTPEGHMRALEESHAAVAARPTFVPGNPITRLPESELVRAIKARPEFAFTEAEMHADDPDAQCSIAQVDLHQIVAVQSIVRIDDLERRLVRLPISEEQLYTLCFPTSEPSDTVTIDASNWGYTITTLDPNIQVAPLQTLPVDPPLELPTYQLQYPSASSALPMQLFPFALLRAPNYLQVVHYQDRYILRNGYTRAAALLYQNIQHVPCMLIETENPDLVGFKPDMLDPDSAMGERPPTLRDFWDDAVTCQWARPATRKIYHIKVEQIEVWR